MAPVKIHCDIQQMHFQLLAHAGDGRARTDIGHARQRLRPQAVHFRIHPFTGATRRLSGKLAVGKPMVRPSSSPCTTRPEMLYGWPSRVSASGRSSSLSAMRIAVLLMRRSPSRKVGVLTTSKPYSFPACCNSGKSP